MPDLHFLTESDLSAPWLEGGAAILRGFATGLSEAGEAWSSGPAPLAGERGPNRNLVDGRLLPRLPEAPFEEMAVLVHHASALAGADRDAIRATEQARLPRFARVVATSEAVAARLREAFGVPAGRLRVVGPGVDDAARSAGSGGGSCHILSVGALVPRKGHATLLRAVARLFDLDWRLTIIGDARRDPVHAAELGTLAAELGIASRVTLAGAADDKALESAWRGADVFALLSNWEGAPSSTMAALRRGLPVAVSTGGANAEPVTPESGVTCAPGDHEQLSKALRRLIFDGPLRAEMAEAAWQRGQALPRWVDQARLLKKALA